MSEGPARGYSWEQFQPGNTVSTHHGAYSPRRVDPLARELVDGLLVDESAAYIRAASFRPAVWAWARAEAQVQLLTEYLEREGEKAGDGVGNLSAKRVQTAYLLLHRAETRATTGRRQLGLDPLSRARLGKDVAMTSAADAAAELTRMRERHERAAAAVVQGETVQGEAVDG